MPTTIHPTSRTLVAYLDGELPVEERHDISAHLRGCETCRNELDAIETDLDWFLVLEAAARPVEPPPLAAGLDRLLCATREWSASQADSAAAGRVEERLAEAAGLLFGPELADADAEGPHSLLTAFLGKRAAKTLVSDIRRRREPSLNPGIG